MIRTLAFAFLLLAAVPAAAQYVEPHPTVVKLWPNGAPGSESRRNEPETAKDYWVANIHDPSLTVYAADPKHRNGAAIIIFPGGGHEKLVFNNEGVKGALALNRYGITAFVLKYRLAREPGSTYTIEGTAAGDARRAVRWVRAHASDYGIDPHRIGVMGFSAGGELVSLIADNPDPETAHPERSRGADPLDRVDGRPDFQILVFPGPLGVPAKDVADAPPAFITAGSLDECCATPAIALYEQLRKAKVPAELHMYAGAGHAFNLDESNRISILHWPDRLADWMADQGLLDGGPRH
ncbi:MAG TPA: alpha/beta hydrolase [Allosphingosinicella sp.]|nr:alpha/beta hydrolase [Allosphingosinicella sp.]